jgi:cytidylate kinase
MSFTVAVDGPAASGKGTIARAVAERFGLGYLDTGLLYRAVGLRALEASDRGEILPETARAMAETLEPAHMEDPAIRSDRAARAASQVAAMPAVRAALREFQRGFAAREGGAVLDGRDIGTVICPEADVKLFVTAGLETRTERRLKELAARGESPDREAVWRDLAERDARDTARADAPLARAPDAHLLDTTDLTIEGAIAEAVEIIEQELGRAG